MTSPTPTLVSWSSGKDSAWSLHLLQQSSEYQVAGLLTTINSEFDRVAMHGTRREILEAQARAAGVPLYVVPIPNPCTNEQYEAAMRTACDAAVASGIRAIAFGDLFLEDVRKYREHHLRGTGLTPVFPVWGLDTRRLAEDIIAAGVKTRIVCVDPKQLAPEFAGRDLDEAFLQALPPGVDPCGENGEFHTCVYAGPMFRRPIPIESGQVVTRDGFVFADVRLAESA